MLLGEGRWDNSSGKARMTPGQARRRCVPPADTSHQLSPHHCQDGYSGTQRWTCHPIPKDPRPPYREQCQGLWMTISSRKSPHPNSLRCLGSLQLAHLPHSFHWFIDLKVVSLGNSFVVQWLQLRALTARGLGPISGWGTKILQASCQGQKSSIFVLFKLLFNSYLSFSLHSLLPKLVHGKFPKHDSCSWQELHRTL